VHVDQEKLAQEPYSHNVAVLSIFGNLPLPRQVIMSNYTCYGMVYQIWTPELKVPIGRKRYQRRYVDQCDLEIWHSDSASFPYITISN